MDLNNQSYKLIVNEVESKLRIDKLLANNLLTISRSRIQQLIIDGHLLVDGLTIRDCSLTVKSGMLCILTIPPAVESSLISTPIKLDIVYEDEALLVINKQAGLTVHPGAGNYQDTLVNGLLNYCNGQLSGIGGVLRPGIVHRLDKDTSGLMVVAKSDKAHLHLAKQIADRSLIRQYLAIIWGKITPICGTIISNLARSKYDHTKITTVKAGGKQAITHYRIIKCFLNESFSLVECKLQTGRTHQIRVQLSNLGHSLLGDQKYGNNKRKFNKNCQNLSQTISQFKRQALHAKLISFTHPYSNDLLTFESAMPVDMNNLLAELA